MSQLPLRHPSPVPPYPSTSPIQMPHIPAAEPSAPPASQRLPKADAYNDGYARGYKDGVRDACQMADKKMMEMKTELTLMGMYRIG